MVDANISTRPAGIKAEEADRQREVCMCFERAAEGDEKDEGSSSALAR